MGCVGRPTQIKCEVTLKIPSNFALDSTVYSKLCVYLYISMYLYLYIHLPTSLSTISLCIYLYLYLYIYTYIFIIFPLSGALK